MTVIDISGLLAEGLAAHQAGRLAEAEQRYRRALTTDPANPDALHLIGVVALQNGRPADAAASVQQAISVAPGQPTYWNTLGVAQQAEGRLDDAADSFARAVELAPAYADGWVNLAAIHQQRGDRPAEAAALERVTALQPANALAWSQRGMLAYAADRLNEACDCFREAAALQPDAAGAWSNLGAAQLRLGLLADAEANQRRAVALDPNSIAAWNNLGNVLVARCRWQEAAEVLVGVVQCAPDDPNGWTNFGHALAGLDRYQEAQDAFQHALDLNPSLPAALVGMGDCIQKLQHASAAVSWYERALAIQPDNPDACEHYGVALQTLARLPEAEAMFRRCIALDPERAQIHSAVIFVLDLQEGAEAAAAEERRRWNAHFGRQPGAAPAVHLQDRTPSRRLRVGYVSADFRHHSAAYAILPILRAHDRAQVEVFCYSGVRQSDHVTAQIRSLADGWHDVAQLNDDELAALIRYDRIDILVDLSGHSGDNRLTVFAHEPAPVQVTAWGYAASTGLNTMRYFLADAVVVPPEARTAYSEEVISLPSVLCYEAPPYLPRLTQLPAASRGYVTFGAFNRLPKVSDDAVATWGKVLAAVPTARLLLKCSGADISPERERLLARLAGAGIAPERVTLLGSTPHPDHLAAHAEIDIMLDTFPQSGGITTLDALVMGVPVVTLLGERVPGRVSASFLTTLGLSDLVTSTPRQYVEIAARLAGDLPRLQHERATLRERLYASPIGNAPLYTRAVEAIYQQLWQRWLAEDTAADPQAEVA
ncbi:MAG: tetratricopeptide repeat protein [Chloroflexi bacterium]|nr:tetratricopeptide repeat protein [Chloroflexota bacterium]